MPANPFVISDARVLFVSEISSAGPMCPACKCGDVGHPRTPGHYASPRAAQATAVTVNGSEGTRRWHSARNAMRWAALRLAR